MKRIVIILIGLISVAYGQSSPTSSKTRFVNGLYLGTKLDSYFNAADSNAIYWRADSVVMAKYKGTARALLFASDSSIYFSNVVRTFGDQAINGLKTFGNTLATSSGVGIISGSSTSPYSATATRGVIHIAGSTDRFLSMGSDFYIYSASSISQLNSVPNLDFFVGGGSRARILATNGNFLINKTADNLLDKLQVSGNGNFSDTVKANVGVISSVTSSLLKADASGVVSAAVAGDITSLISGTYLPLSGGTLTGALNGTSASFSGAGAFGANTTITGSGRVLGLRKSSAFTGNLYTGYQNESSTEIGIVGYSSTSNNTFSIINGVGDITLQPTSTVNVTGALNGTSLSMSGEGLFGGAVTDGTNKLIVNGGVKGGNFNGTNFISSAQSNTINIGQVTNYPNYNFIGFGGYWGLRTDNSNGFNIDVFNSNSPINALNITTSGAITASSSVTATNSIFNNSSSGGRIEFQTSGTRWGGIGSGQWALADGTTDITIYADATKSVKIAPNGVLGATFSSTGLNVVSSVTASSFVSNASISATSSITAGTSISVTGNTTPKFQINRGTYTTSGLIEYLNNSSLRWTTGLNGNQGGYFIYNGSAGANAFNIDTLSNANFASTIYAQGYRFAYSAKSSNYTLTDNDDYIVVSNASTITLPTAVGRAGKRYVIRSTAGAGVTSSLATTSSQTVDGAAGTFSFGNGNYNILIVFSDGANWFSEQWITGS